MENMHITLYIDHLSEVQSELQWHLDETSDHTNCEFLQRKINEVNELIHEIETTETLRSLRN